ncbi:MAG: DUF1824 family protein [Cyanobacteria bacterium P01_F01_bin.150]
MSEPTFQSGQSEQVEQSTPSVDAAHKLLISFDCANPRDEDQISTSSLREALLILNRHSDYHILGICAENIAQGFNTFLQYGQALGDGLEEMACPEHDGPVYIKYNTKTGLFHVDAYIGSHRGVLVSFQSAYEHGVNDLYGHFPLDLFKQPEISNSETVTK